MCQSILDDPEKVAEVLADLPPHHIELMRLAAWYFEQSDKNMLAVMYHLVPKDEP